MLPTFFVFLMSYGRAWTRFSFRLIVLCGDGVRGNAIDPARSVPHRFSSVSCAHVVRMESVRPTVVGGNRSARRATNSLGPTDVLSHLAGGVGCVVVVRPFFFFFFSMSFARDFSVCLANSLLVCCLLLSTFLPRVVRAPAGGLTVC